MEHYSYSLACISPHSMHRSLYTMVGCSIWGYTIYGSVLLHILFQHTRLLHFRLISNCQEPSSLHVCYSEPELKQPLLFFEFPWSGPQVIKPKCRCSTLSILSQPNDVKFQDVSGTNHRLLSPSSKYFFLPRLPRLKTCIRSWWTLN